MNEVLRFLREHPVQFLATVGFDGKPKVRPFQFMLEEDGKLWFCTGRQKAVYAELQKQPFLELSASGSDNTWLRISARAQFKDNPGVKERIIASNPLVKSIYHTGDNPVFAVFYLMDGTAVIRDFSGNPPQIDTI